jgi:N-sulfoglucosamine sulfohydrolase
MLAATLGGALSACKREPEKPPRTNILFAMSDDQSWVHTGAAGSKLVKTPAFDRVAREGMMFTNSYCASPSCTPSRSAILTGRQMWQVEEMGVLYGTIPPKYPLFTHLLEDAGYHVGFTGKSWAPGNWKAGGATRLPVGKAYNSRRVEERLPPGISPYDYAANFEDFLNARKPDTPFFFWFGSQEPHRIYDPGLGLRYGKKLADVDVPAFLPDSEEIRGDILDYCAEIDYYDTHLEQMLKKLEAIGELENTIVVCTSDNGMPFPRAKANLYDYGTRMPLAIRWGKRIQGGRKTDAFTSHIDFAPTFLEAAGVPTPAGTTGKSLIPTLAGEKQDGRDCVYTAMERHTWCRPEGAGYPMRALRTADHLYIRNFAPDRWPTGGPEFISSNKTTNGDVDGGPTKDFMTAPANQRKFARQYALAFGKRPAEELYELASDPDQMKNLAADPKHKAAKDGLSTRLEAYLKQTGDPRIEGRDPWQSYVYHEETGYGAKFNRSLSEEERKKAMLLKPIR